MSDLSTPVQQRRSVLDFCLAPLKVQLGGEAPGEVPATLEVSGQTLDLDGWEQNALQESMGAGPEAAKPWASLVAEGVAFRVGCKLRAAGLDDNSSTAEASITFLAAGLALSSEIQQMVDLLIVAGDVGSAKRLTQFRNKIGQDVKTLRDRVGNDDFVRAEQESADLIGPPGSSLPVSSSNGPSPRGAGEYKGKKKTTPTPLFDLPDDDADAPDVDEGIRQRRVRRMSLLLFGSTFVWMLFFMPRLFEPRAQVLQKLQFEHLPAVSTVTARPPSLYIEVEPQAWDALDPGDRRAMLDEIGRIALGADYNGVQVKQRGGAVVGRWLRAEGARLVSGS